MHALLVVATLAAAAGSDAGVVNTAGPRLRVPGRALLKLKDVDDARALKVGKATDPEHHLLAEIGDRHGVRLTFVKASLFGWAVVDVRDAAGGVPDEDATRDIVVDLGKDAAVDVVAEESWMRTLATPNDPGLPQMWHIDQIGAKAAWDVTTGLSSQRIGVADTGIVRNHEDLRNRIVTGFDFVTDSNAGNDGNGRDSDFADAGDACNGSPSSFHGTHVAGTMAAEANNGKGVAGLNWNAGLVVARVLGRCGGSSVDIMEGAAWMAGAHIDGIPDVGANKVSVMNLSLGGANRCSAFEQQAIDFINSQGTLFVAAAGNDGGAVGSPANCNGTVAVSAVGSTNRRASYSSFGSQTSIFAPGGDGGTSVLSSIGPGAASYRGQNGTSMASPHVAGAISLLQALRPNLTRTEAINLLRSTGAPCTNCQGVPAMRIGAAVASLGGAQPPPPAVPPPPSAGADDAFEDNDTAATATRATCGVDDTRPIARAGDQDWFSFTPPQGRRISIAIDGGAPDLDLYVLDGAGQNILARSESGTGVERITGTAGGGTLMVLVNPYTDTARGIAHQGPYRLTLTCGGAVTTQSVTDFEAGDPFEEVLGEVDDDEDLEEVVAPGLEENPAFDPNSDNGISASGGCNAVGFGAAPVALLGLLLRRRRRC